jgi:DNA polymerase-3 subunit gamma/tau
MFENLLGQDEAARTLRSDLEAGSLPPSMLFEGPPLSAKATAALELARASSCQHGAPWNCSCEHCRRHRLLAHPDTLLFGPKSLREELAAGAELLARAPGDPARYFFMRAARKLTKRFDQELYAGEESRLAKALPLVRSVMEASDACMPGNAADAEAAKEAAKILPSCAKLNELIADATPVYQIRSMEAWARQTPVGPKKTIIIEHADRMLDASRNALLKILEEPPSFTRFVLTSSRKQALIPTILSRVRSYRFQARSRKDAAAVLERVFRLKDPPALSLEAFFRGYKPEGSGALAGASRAFAAALLAELRSRRGELGEAALNAMADTAKRSPGEAIADAAEACANFGANDEAMAWSFAAFLDESSAAFAGLMRSSGAGNQSLAIAELYAEAARDALLRYTGYNLNPLALAERLAFEFFASLDTMPWPAQGQRGAAP